MIRVDEYYLVECGGGGQQDDYTDKYHQNTYIIVAIDH